MEKISTCHSAVAIEDRDGGYHCGVCGKPCDLQGSMVEPEKEAAAPQQEEGQATADAGDTTAPPEAATETAAPAAENTDEEGAKEGV